MDRTSKRDSEVYEKRIADLQAQLDRELEWKPSEGTGTNMTQADYESCWPAAPATTAIPML